MAGPPSIVRSAATLLAVALLGACADGRLEPVPPLSDPDALRVGEPLYACGQWTTGSEPTVPTTLTVDVHFAPDTAFRGPTETEVAALTTRGGSLIYRYSFPAARVAISSTQIPNLVDSGLAVAVVSVPDPLRFDWRFVLVMAGELTAADSGHVVWLGGRVVAMLRALHFITAELPDASVPYLRRWPQLQYAEPDSFVCPAGAA